MITERIALVMLNGGVANISNDPHHTREFYNALQNFADVSIELCEQGKYQRLERLIKLAFKFFKEGNECVKNAVVSVYLYSLSRSLDRHPEARTRIEPFMPYELRLEYGRFHYATGM